jgi:iron complex outermembrane receptor protein
MLSQKITKAACVILLALIVQISFAQQKTITGQVKDVNGNPLRGATVSVKGSRTGTQTDANGTFSLSVDNTASTLVISSVGFTTQEISISSNSTVDVALTVNNTTMGEVVIIGYGTAAERTLRVRSPPLVQKILIKDN